MREDIDELEPVEDEELLEEDAPLSAEEIFEQHKAEIDAAFEEKSFFRRLKEMCSGLSKPKSSAEYKLAKTELQRLSAPLAGILIPTIGVVVLIVVTAISGQTKKTIQVDVVKLQDEEQELVEDKEEDIPDEPPPEEQIDVQVDTPVVGPVTDIVAPQTPTLEPVSVKPAAVDSVMHIKSPVTMKSMASSRTPGMIGRLTSGGGMYGDPATEAAVLKALRWLKKTQKPAGNWDGTIANTALAVLTYLAHGEIPSSSKEFGQTVQKAIQYLIDAQTTNKDGQTTYKGVDGNEYATLICTYALCEAFGMTQNPNAKIAAQLGLERIVNNQSPTGGWDYKINKNSPRDDMSFEGWALQAIKAGKMAGLHPEGMDECIKKAIKCLKSRNFKGIGFNYTAGGAPTGLTATGCLCMQLLGYMNDVEVKTALNTMREWKPVFEAKGGLTDGGPTPGSAPQYYCYYAAQCKYQAGLCQGATPANVKIWQDWNAAMKALYPPSIITLPETIEGIDGKPKAIGYWKGGYNNDTMGTCLVALQLMVYYRYLPTTQTKAAKVEAHDDDDSASSGAADKSTEVDVEVDI